MIIYREMIKKLYIRRGDRKRWRVLYNEGNWLCGLYKPEFRRKNEVVILERHNAPELFLLIDGKITLLVKRDRGRLRELKMKKGEVIVLTDWHNAYSPDARGEAIVIEKNGVKTTFKSIKDEKR